MPLSISSDITLNANSTAPTGTTRSAIGSFNLPDYNFTATDVWADSSNGTTAIQNAFANTVAGIRVEDNTSVTVGAGVSTTGLAWALETNTASGNNQTGGTININGGKLTAAALVCNRTLTIADNADTRARLANINITEGGTLAMMTTSIRTYTSLIGNEGQVRWTVRDGSIVQNVNTGGSSAPLGTNLQTLYLGHYSIFDDAFFETPNKIEFQNILDEFRNVRVSMSAAGSINSDGLFYLGAFQDLHIDLSGSATVTIDSGVSTATYTYFALRPDNTSYTFQAGIPSDVKSYEFGFGTGGGATPGVGRTMYFQNEVTSSVNTLDANGQIDGTSNGKFLLLDADNNQEIGSTLASGQIPSADRRYTWYTLDNRSFTSTGANYMIPIGWPDSRLQTTNASMRCFSAAGAKSSGLYSTSNIRSATNATVITSTADAGPAVDHLRNTTRRGYPFRAIVSDWGYLPLLDTAQGGTATFTNASGSNTAAALAAAEASADAVRNGFSVAASLELDEALVGVNETGSVSGVNDLSVTNDIGDITFTGANTTLENVYIDHRREIHQKLFDGSYVRDFTIGSASTFVNDNAQSSITNITSGTPTSNQLAFRSSDGTILNLQQNNPQWNDIAFVDCGSNAATIFNYNWRRGIAIYRTSTTGQIIFAYDRAAQARGSYTAAVTEIIYVNSDPLSPAGSIKAFASIAHAASTPTLTQDKVFINYLTRSDVGLTPMRANGSTLELRRLQLSAESNGTFAAGNMFTTINLDANSRIDLNASELTHNVTGSGSVVGFSTTSTAAAPAIAAGMTVGSGVTLEFNGGQTYYIAGDISNATLTRNSLSSGTVTLAVVGDGALPSSAVTNFSFVKEVTVSVTAPGSNTWSSSDFSTDAVINIAAYSAASASALQPLRLVSSFPSTAINEPSLAYSVNISGTDGRWTAGYSGDGGFTPLTSFPSSWDWRDTTRQDGRVHNGLNIAGLTSAEITTVRNWIATAGYHYVVMYANASNWAIYKVPVANTLGISGNLQIQQADLVRSAGVPQSSGMTFYAAVDSNGYDVALVENDLLTNPTPALSNGNQTLTYTYLLAPTDDLYYAFGARNGTSGNWYGVVSGNSESSTSLTHTLEEFPAAVIPTAFSSGTGLAAHLTYINAAANQVVKPIHLAPTSTIPMPITIADTVAEGTSLDGHYLHRLVQQKDAFLGNVASGVWPLNGWTNEQTGVMYSNTYVEWRKATATTAVVNYAVPTTDTLGGSVNNDITTTNVQTLVSFNPASLSAFIPADQLTQLTNVEGLVETIDRTTKATLGQVL